MSLGLSTLTRLMPSTAVSSTSGLVGLQTGTLTHLNYADSQILHIDQGSDFKGVAKEGKMA